MSRGGLHSAAPAGMARPTRYLHQSPADSSTDLVQVPMRTQSILDDHDSLSTFFQVTGPNGYVNWDRMGGANVRFDTSQQRVVVTFEMPYSSAFFTLYGSVGPDHSALEIGFNPALPGVPAGSLVAVNPVRTRDTDDRLLFAAPVDPNTRYTATVILRKGQKQALSKVVFLSGLGCVHRRVGLTAGLAATGPRTRLCRARPSLRFASAATVASAAAPLPALWWVYALLAPSRLTPGRRSRGPWPPPRRRGHLPLPQPDAPRHAALERRQAPPHVAVPAGVAAAGHQDPAAGLRLGPQLAREPAPARAPLPAQCRGPARRAAHALAMGRAAQPAACVSERVQQAEAHAEKRQLRGAEPESKSTRAESCSTPLYGPVDSSHI